MERELYYFIPSLNYCFKNINYEFKGNINYLKLVSEQYSENSDWVMKYFPYSYKNRNKIINL